MTQQQILAWGFLVVVGISALIALVFWIYSMWLQRKYENQTLPALIVDEEPESVWGIDDSLHNTVEDPEALKMLREVNSN